MRYTVVMLKCFLVILFQAWSVESYDTFLCTSLDVKSFPTTAHEPRCCAKISWLQLTTKQTVPFSFCTKRRIVNSRLRNSSLRANYPISFREGLSRDFPKWSEPVMSHSNMWALPSLTLSFHPRPRPFIWRELRNWQLIPGKSHEEN